MYTHDTFGNNSFTTADPQV